MPNLLSFYKQGVIEAGCDEAGRGCLSGPVFAAAVVLPTNFNHKLLNDSKQLTEKQRYALRQDIQNNAIDWAIGICSAQEIDEYNILNASIYSMHKALGKLNTKPEHIIIDGNRFKPFQNIDYKTIVKGDSKYFSIAAASVLAKTYRDDFMIEAHNKYPEYNWKKNKGYPTKEHRMAIEKFGISPYHRKTFRLFDKQLKIVFG